MKKVLKIIGIISLSGLLLFIIGYIVIYLLAVHSLSQGTKKQKEYFADYTERHEKEFTTYADELERYINIISEETGIPPDNIGLFVKYSGSMGNYKKEISIFKNLR